MNPNELPIPAHFDPSSVDQIWRVPYQTRAEQAQQWARRQNITPQARIVSGSAWC
jgi:hypothetical protein